MEIVVLIALFVAFIFFVLWAISTEETQNSIFPKERLSFSDEGEYAGYEGELKVAEAVDYFCKRYNDKLLCETILLNQNDGRTTEIDVLLFSLFGVFVIEVKNHQGVIITSNDTDDWSQVRDDGTTRNHRSPISQNQGHVYALQKVLGNDYKNCIYSIVVYVQNNAPQGFENEVCNLCDLQHLIESHRIEISEEKRDRAFEIVQEYTKNNPVDKLQHQQNVHNK